MDVSEFTTRYYELCGAEVREVTPGLCLVSLGPEAVRVTDNPWTPPYQLLLGFNRELVEANPQAELVESGSFRLDRIITAVGERGRLARAYLPAGDPLAARRAVESWYRSRAAGRDVISGIYFLGERQEWEPYLVIHISVASVAEGRQETLLLPGLNLVTGNLVRDFSSLIPPESAALPEAPGKERRRKVSFKRAYAALMDHAVRWVSERDGSWAREATRRFEEEARRLEVFYDGLARELRNEEDVAEALTETKRRRLEEQRDRFSPRVLVRPRAVALLYVPVILVTALACTRSGDERLTLVYDPVTLGISPDWRSPFAGS